MSPALRTLGRRLSRGWVLGVLLAIAQRPAPTLALSLAQANQGPPQHLPITAQWCLAPLQPQRCIALEVAASPRQQALGLQLRPPLPPLRGMWFPYSPAAVARFWMHRTPAPLDMLFIRDGQVVAIEAHTQPCMQLPCPSYGPDEPVDGVVELAAGQAAALGLRVGSPARIERIQRLKPLVPVPPQPGGPGRPGAPTPD